MAKVERGNVVLTVDDEDVDFYVNKGYNLVEDGKVIREAVPNDLGELRQYYVNAHRKIQELENTIAVLSAENRRLQKKSQRVANN